MLCREITAVCSEIHIKRCAGDVVPFRTMKAYRESRGIAPLILSSGTGKFDATAASLLAKSPLHMGLGVQQSRAGLLGKEKDQPLLAIEPRFLGLVASRGSPVLTELLQMSLCAKTRGLAC
jgi:hypothetical protein